MAKIIKKSDDNRYAYINEKGNKLKKKYIYTCCMCGTEIIDYRPVRFVKQLYGYGQYKQYYSIRNYDFCKECYEVLDDLFFKWKRTKG